MALPIIKLMFECQAHVWFVFNLPLDLGHGQALKRQSLHPRHTNNSGLRLVNYKLFV